MYPYGFPKHALIAYFLFYQCTQNHSPYPSVPRLKYFTSGVSYNAATSIASTIFCSENLIFHLEYLFQNQPPSYRGKMTTPLKIHRYYTGHITPPPHIFKIYETLFGFFWNTQALRTADNAADIFCSRNRLLKLLVLQHRIF